MSRLRVAIVIAITSIFTPLVAFADHFDPAGSATGSFAPAFSVKNESPIEGQPSSLELVITQQDHEDPVRLLYLKAAAGWQFGVDAVRASQKADGSANHFRCGDALSAPDAQNLKQVATAEIVGKLAVSAQSDATPPRTPISWSGDLYWLSWNPPSLHGLTLSTGFDSTSGKPYIDASWEADPLAGTYTVYLRQLGERFTSETVVTTNSHRFTKTAAGSDIVAGTDYAVAIKYASEGPPATESYSLINAGAGTVEPKGIMCAQITTYDQRVWNLYNTGVGDLRQLNFPFPMRQRAEGRWEIIGDLTSLWSDQNVQLAQTSALSLTATLFANTKGNWNVNVDGQKVSVQGFTKNAPVSFTASPWKATKQFDAIFHPCHAHAGGAAQPCGPLAQSGKPDVARVANVDLYPGRARPDIISPRSSDVLIGTNTVTIGWKPHRYSYGTSDSMRGLKGYRVRVVPYSQSFGPAECPTGAIYCRGAEDPILVGENGNGVAADLAGNVQLTLTYPSDAWYVYRVVAVYNDGFSSFETDLSSVKGASSGMFFVTTTPWPLIYLDPSGPVLLFVDPAQKKFNLQLTSLAMAYTDPNMAYAAGADGGEGVGAFTFTASGNNLFNHRNISIVFNSDSATGFWTHNQQNGSSLFKGTRIR